MPQNFDGVNLLFPRQVDWAEWAAPGGDEPFSEPVLAFLNALSVRLLKEAAVREFPDVGTFGFFCRRANLLAMKEASASREQRLGRGVLFHIAPSNVPINFAFSLAAGLLSGSRNIVRVSTRAFAQVDIVVRAIEGLAAEHPAVANRIAIVRYDRASAATTEFSRLCDVRIIWGGDETIEQIRRSPIPSRAFDVTFADRYSLAVIGAEKLNQHKGVSKLAEAFYNDTYLFDQNACSAPHLVVWLGPADAVAVAREKFWSEVQAVVSSRYEIQPVMAVRKLAAFCTQAVAMPVRKEEGPSNALWRVRLLSVTPGIDEFRCIGGYFTEYAAGSLAEIAPIVTRKYQTLAYFGVAREDLLRFVVDHRLAGFDRIVPFGATTEFALTWDGFDLIQTLTRKIAVR